MKTTTIRDYLRRDPEGESYRLVERTLEPPMLALSLLFIPVILGPLLSELSGVHPLCETRVVVSSCC